MKTQQAQRCVREGCDQPEGTCSAEPESMIMGQVLDLRVAEAKQCHAQHQHCYNRLQRGADSGRAPAPQSLRA